MDIADFYGHVRPDACPGALQVHTAADGALARIRIPGGALSATQLREVAACSAELGSGVIELTSRANLQLRGLPPADAPSATEAGAFAARIAAVGLLPSETHERVRNILASPLAGRVEASLVDVRPLVTALDRGLCASPELTGLSGRFLFALDDGTGDLLSIGADVTFLATSPSGGLLHLGGATAGIPVLVDEVVPSMLAAASAFLELSGGTAWRVGDLPDGPALLASRLLHGGPAASRDEGGSPGGPSREIASLRAPDARVVPQRDGRVALEVVVPLGRLSADQARALADVADEVRVTPWRTAVLPDLRPEDVERVADELTTVGLVTGSGTAWAGLSACTGSPGCAKSLADVQGDARRWAMGTREPSTPAVPDDVLVHWAGCERRCGRPKGEVADVVATPTGYRVGHGRKTEKTETRGDM
ncbi:precorrin-3B synthase [Nonomuraea recticatena]|uniref:precorrin-3B synthase n=1 Tax=Nonomuraea recticatena TaxID=46178 RepID=UPI0031F90CD2